MPVLIASLFVDLGFESQFDAICRKYFLLRRIGSLSLFWEIYLVCLAYFVAPPESVGRRVLDPYECVLFRR